MFIWQLFTKWVGAVREPYAIFLAVQSPVVPVSRKIIVSVVTLFLLSYVVNPIDIIPDYIPFFWGLIDDLVLIPAAIWFIDRLLPDQVIKESRVRAEAALRPFTVVINVISIILLIIVVTVVSVIGYLIWRLFFTS